MEEETMAMTSDLGGSAHAAGSAQIVRRSSISDPPTAIQKLPSEMLAAVFEAGARITLQDGGLPFVIVVSHVCRYWRIAAYSFPNAWCYIPVHLQRDTMTELFLSRSRGHLLDICLFLGEFVVFSSIKDALKLIAPSTPRWTRFCIRVRVITDIIPAQRYTRTLQDMSCLQAFELRIDRTIDNYSMLGLTADLLGTPLPPKLEAVVCVGMSMGYWSPALRGLTRLTLENLKAPSPSDFRELCIQNPRLEYLKLVNTSPPLYVDWDGQFALNSLRTLEFALDEYDESYDNKAYVARFFRALSVPALQELWFRTNFDSAWEGFDLTISTTAFVTGHDMLFHDLRVLHLVISQPITVYYSVSASLLSNFPKLKELSFHASDDRIVQDLLHGWIYTMTTDTLPFEIWPQLKTLVIRTPYYASEEVEGLFDLLKSLRRSEDRPIEAWWESVSTITYV